MQPQYEASPAMFRNHPLLFIGSVLLIAAFGLGILILLYWYLKVRSVRLTITGNLVHLSRGLLSKEQIDLDVQEIRAVHVKQRFLQRVFNVGTLEFYTAGDTAELTLDGMPDPNRVRDYIRKQVQEN